MRCAGKAAEGTRRDTGAWHRLQTGKLSRLPMCCLNVDAIFWGTSKPLLVSVRNWPCAFGSHRSSNTQSRTHCCRSGREVDAIGPACQNSLSQPTEAMCTNAPFLGAARNGSCSHSFARLKVQALARPKGRCMPIEVVNSPTLQVECPLRIRTGTSSSPASSCRARRPSAESRPQRRPAGHPIPQPYSLAHRAAALLEPTETSVAKAL